MIAEQLSPTELNEVEKKVEHAEARWNREECDVCLSARTARILLEMAGSVARAEWLEEELIAKEGMNMADAEVDWLEKRIEKLTAERDEAITKLQQKK